MLVERDASLIALDAELSLVISTRTGRLVVVAGEPGVGKTSLVRAFCDGAPPRVRVLWGACEPLRTPRPLGPVLDIADATGGALAERVDGEPRPYAVAAALMDELRQRAPSVVVLEDVHWADEATLDVMTMLGRRVAIVPALVVVTVRDDELGRAEQLRAVLGDLADHYERITLAPLSLNGVTTLSAAHAIDAGELHRRTAGNPFYVAEVLAAGTDRLPNTIRDAVLARARRLSSTAQRVLQAVSIVPGCAELWLLDALAGDSRAGLEDCLAAGMLTATATRVAFRHELARLAIETTITPHQCLALHQAAISALANLPAGTPDAARLAHHAATIDDADAVLHWAPLAGERAASAAHREAAAHHGLALRYGQHLGATALSELYERQAGECLLTNEHDAAVEAMRRALELRRQLGDPLALGKLLSSIVALGCAETTSDAVAEASEAVALLEPLGPSPELVRAYAARAHVCIWILDVVGGQSWGARAVELAERLGDTEGMIRPLIAIGASKVLAGDPTGEQQLLRSLKLAQRAGLDDDVGRAYYHLVAAAEEVGDCELVERYLQDGIAFCAERNLDLWRGQLTSRRAMHDLNRGRLAAAALLARELLAGRPDWNTRVLLLMVEILARARSGDLDVRAQLEEATTLNRPSDDSSPDAEMAVLHAELLWLTGRADEIDAATGAALAHAVAERSTYLIGELACWRRRAGLDDEIPDGPSTDRTPPCCAGTTPGPQRSTASTNAPTRRRSRSPTPAGKAICAKRSRGSAPSAPPPPRRSSRASSAPLARGVSRTGRAPPRAPTPPASPPANSTSSSSSPKACVTATSPNNSSSPRKPSSITSPRSSPSSTPAPAARPPPQPPASGCSRVRGTDPGDVAAKDRGYPRRAALDLVGPYPYEIDTRSRRTRTHRS